MLRVGTMEQPDDTLPAARPRTKAQSRTVYPTRYQDLGRIGVGGQGEVRRVLDTHLQREVAMKILHPRFGEDSGRMQRFVDEARGTARLQHPSIVPVYDWGALPDGRPWFTMRIVEGQTLAEVVAEAVFKDGSRLHYLVGLLERASLAVAHAHALGTVHRDLKPSNLMVGPFGELMVMDWGFSTPLGTSTTGVGTPPYMAPEQTSSAAAPASPATDIYALGTLLYLVLTGLSPYDQTGLAGVQQILAGPPRSVREARPDWLLPDLLCDLVAAAMAREPSDRPQNALDLAQGMRSWLDGESERKRATQAMDQVSDLPERAANLRVQARQQEAEAKTLLGQVQRREPVDAKRQAWALQDQAQAKREDAERLEVRYEANLRTALALKPGLTSARASLAQHLLHRLDEAVNRREGLSAARYSALLEDVDPVRHREWRDGVGFLSFNTCPPGASVQLERAQRSDRRLQWHACDQQITPFRIPLSAGSYRLRIQLPGHADTTHTVRIKRGEEVCDSRPGAVAPTPVQLLPKAACGPNEVYIPGGWTQVGGDPEIPDAIEPHRVWVDSFALALRPVTVAEFTCFLADLPEQEAAAHAPTLVDGTPLWTREAGRWILGPVGAAPWAADRAMVLVSWRSAMAYASWRSAQDGRPWRLPHELEWARAARGADGRRFPWGDFLDPSWACMKFSHRGDPAPESVYDRPDDVSPYGVFGMGGNVRDLCLNAYLPGSAPKQPYAVRIEPPPEQAQYRSVRGGSWFSAATFCSAAARFVMSPDERTHSAGFRLARSL